MPKELFEVVKSVIFATHLLLLLLDNFARSKENICEDDVLYIHNNTPKITDFAKERILHVGKAFIAY